MLNTYWLPPGVGYLGGAVCKFSEWINAFDSIVLVNKCLWWVPLKQELYNLQIELQRVNNSDSQRASSWAPSLAVQWRVWDSRNWSCPSDAGSRRRGQPSGMSSPPDRISLRRLRRQSGRIGSKQIGYPNPLAQPLVTTPFYPKITKETKQY